MPARFGKLQPQAIPIFERVLSHIRCRERLPQLRLYSVAGRPDEVVRRAAAAALGELKAQKSVDALLARLKDDDPGVRKAAAIALGRIGDPRAASAVLASVPEAASGQWEYAAALYRLGKRDHLDQVTAALRSEYPDTRRGALTALLEFGDNRLAAGAIGARGQR